MVSRRFSPTSPLSLTACMLACLVSSPEDKPVWNDDVHACAPERYCHARLCEHVTCRTVEGQVRVNDKVGTRTLSDEPMARVNC